MFHISSSFNPNVRMMTEAEKTLFVCKHYCNTAYIILSSSSNDSSNGDKHVCKHYCNTAYIIFSSSSFYFSNGDKQYAFWFVYSNFYTTNIMKQNCNLKCKLHIDASANRWWSGWFGDLGIKDHITV